MTDFKQDMAKIQELVANAFSETGKLVALADGGQMEARRLQKTLEDTAGQFEASVLELRRLCERYSPGAGGYGKRVKLPHMEVTGYMESYGYGWIHICLNTLLPHCRYQTPAWLTDTIRRLLDDYEDQGGVLPYFQRAMLVIDEHSDIPGRHVYDQDNKGYKAVSNAIKGRLIPDDDQYSLAVCLLSTKCTENACHITLLDATDTADFFALHSGNYALANFYSSR